MWKAEVVTSQIALILKHLELTLYAEALYVTRLWSRFDSFGRAQTYHMEQNVGQFCKWNQMWDGAHSWLGLTRDLAPRHGSASGTQCGTGPTRDWGSLMT